VGERGFPWEALELWWLSGLSQLMLGGRDFASSPDSPSDSYGSFQADLQRGSGCEPSAASPHLLDPHTDGEAGRLSSVCKAEPWARGKVECRTILYS
jgi:hypothetical protein